MTLDISVNHANVQCQDLTPFTKQANFDFNVNKNKKLLMFTGASGGHIIPALALRRHFPDAVIVAVKTEAALEILKDAENVLFIRPLAVKKITLGALKDAARIIVFAWKFKSRRILCFGSYLNVPGVFCAKLTGARLYFFEPNAVPGKGTALLKIFADKIFEIFSGTIKDSAKTVLCKFPVDARKYGKEEARAKLGFDSEKPLILILGGSQGSAFINDLVLRMLSKLRFAQIIHITGPADFNRVNSAYGAHRGNHLVLPVCHYMSLLYSVADAAVSRAGAGTLAELSFYKIPSLLIPYPLAGAHQKKNAEFFSARNSALMISQRNAKEDNVFEALKNMLSGNFWKLSENLAKISVSDDGSDLAEQISAE